MKKSELYSMAMCCVIDNSRLDAGTKLEIIEVLMHEKSLAEWSEEKEEEKS